MSLDIEVVCLNEKLRYYEQIEKDSEGNIIYRRKYVKTPTPTSSLEYYGYVDVLHCVDGPAVISYSASGIKRKEIYYVTGLRHRLNGPSYISYVDNVVSFFIQGVQYKNELDYWLAVERYLNDPHEERK